MTAHGGIPGLTMGHVIPAAAAEPDMTQTPADFACWLQGSYRGQVITDRDMPRWLREYESESLESAPGTRPPVSAAAAAPAPGDNVGAWVDYAPVYEFALLHKLPFNELSAMVRRAALATPAAAAEVSERCTECGFRFGYHLADCSALTDLRAAVDALATPAAAPEPSDSEIAERVDLAFNDYDRGDIAQEALIYAIRRATPAAAAGVSGLTKALQAIVLERSRQDEQWGGPAHDDEHTGAEWVGCIEKQIDAIADEWPTSRTRFIKIATLALAAVESIDRLATPAAAAEPKEPT